MATKKSVKKTSGKFGAKADFIRNQPESMSAKEIVDAAAKQGIKLSVNHVYNLRTSAAKKTDAPLSSLAAPKRGPGRPRSSSNGSNVEQQLRAAIAEVGLQRAREIFDAVAAAFRGR